MDDHLNEPERAMIDRQREGIEKILAEGPSHPDEDARGVCTGWILVAEWMIAGQAERGRRWITVNERDGQSLATDDGLLFTALFKMD